MKNNFYLLFTFLFLCTALKAQHNHDEGHRKEQLERVQAAKVGFLTDKINLTEGQAQKFWPMYNQHSDQRREIFHGIRRKIRTGKEEGVSVLEKNKLLDETMALKEKDLEMQKDFKNKVLDIISVDQYIELMSAEREFNKLLMERLGKRKKPN
jgi:Spy/CpxP family protein refolding chaperone